MGSKLHAAYLAAGLPAPKLRLDASVSAGGEAAGIRMLAEVLETLAPVLRAIDPGDTVGVRTLKERLRAEMIAYDGVIVAPELIGAWSVAA